MQVAVNIRLYEYGHEQVKIRKTDEIIKKCLLKVNMSTESKKRRW
jgi:hypothetical protein